MILFAMPKQKPMELNANDLTKTKADDDIQGIRST